jgi:Lon-like ATP-dependent protease
MEKCICLTFYWTHGVYFILTACSDKLGKGYQGDPASALLELLDPSHNQSFVDHYLDVPVDFSRTLFICTANDESAIPAPLRDRMDILRLSGYDIPEKVAIAKQYLVPKIFKAMGLQRVEVDDKTVGTAINIPHGIDAHISDDALEALIRNYCRESGIRSLEKHIEKIARRIAFLEVSRVEAEVAKEGESGGRVGGCHSMKLGTDSATTMTPYCVTAESLEEFLGSPKYSEETLYSTEDTIPPGVVMGLAWNPLGGAPVFIEAVATPVAFTDTGGSVQVITGQLGDVMKESVNIAYTYARQYVRKLNASNDFFKTHQLHIHCPEGAVGKDGPSAGKLSIIFYLATIMVHLSCSMFCIRNYNCFCSDKFGH